MKKTYRRLITISLLAFFVNGCAGIHSITPSSKETETETKSYTEKEIYDRAVRENKDKWVELGYSRAKKIVNKYADRIEEYEVGKYAVKSKFLTYPKVVATNVNGRLILEARKPRIEKQMSVNEIFDFYGKNADIMGSDKTYKKPNIPYANTSIPTLQDARLGVGGGGNNVPSPARFNVKSATQGVAYVQPNQNKKVYTKKNKQIGLILAKNQKNLNAINEYNLNCMDAGKNFVCDFANKMERDYFCKETGTCR